MLLQQLLDDKSNLYQRQSQVPLSFVALPILCRDPFRKNVKEIVSRSELAACYLFLSIHCQKILRSREQTALLLLRRLYRHKTFAAAAKENGKTVFYSFLISVQ